MTLETEVVALQKVPMFREMDPKRLKLLAFTSERITFAAGQKFFSQGDISDAAYVILEGKADIIIDGPNGPFEVIELGEHQLVGEMGLLTEAPRSANVVATVPTIALRIDKDVFLELMKQFPQMAMAVMREMARRLDMSNERLASYRRES